MSDLILPRTNAVHPDDAKPLSPQEVGDMLFKDHFFKCVLMKMKNQEITDYFKQKMRVPLPPEAIEAGRLELKRIEHDYPQKYHEIKMMLVRRDPELRRSLGL